MYDPAHTEARMDQLQRQLKKMNTEFDKLGKNMAKHLMRSEMQVDSAMKTAVKAHEAVKSHDVRMRTAELQVTEDEDAIVPQTIDQSDLANIFSISFERALTLPNLPVWQTLREALASTTVLILQTLFCFGLAEEQSDIFSQQSQGTDSMTTSYLSTSVEGIGRKIPRIHLAASLCALLLLALTMKNEDEGAVLTVCPLDVVAFSSAYGHLNGKREEGAVYLFDKVYSHICLALVALYMQVLWTIRVALIPSLAALASVDAFASSTNTQQIVLYCVLIAFVLNLDEFLYSTVSALRLRTTHPTPF